MPPDEEMGPSLRYMRELRQQMHRFDEDLTEREQKLVHEYGLKATLEAMSKGGSYNGAVKLLEAKHKPIVRRY